ncbi:hypothetical protein U27_05595 [Candidatus Vecturithrix granuli]|uniref:Baseplate protein J-like barrel domain-containing protein n=1 Tax=Vecturithrix granuli TaxID=1499967 RepID=A0A081C216_VECG1|nr:hypothetical protein U27_05595 [Candidatus Vecturithrix granuli]
MSFRRRKFPEVLENILTTITGGVAAESHPFPPPGGDKPPYTHNLQQPPVSDVVSIYGRRDGEPHLFRKNTDYKLLGDQQTIEWQEGAQFPDPGTLIQINYYPTSAQPILTDIQTGSVVRTLSESVALEIARLYAQLEVVYQAGFIDTASGKALENVVALLGIERVKGGKAAGTVEFTRSPGSLGTINILAGTRIITPDGNVEYETTESVTLGEGQKIIRVMARDLELNDPLPANSLTIIPVPIAGIASVTNPAPTALTTQDETDAELRTRAKSFLHGSERATLGAIKEAIARQGITADVEEVADTPGKIKITPHAESLPPELQQRLLAAIEDARPAGVLVTLEGVIPPRKVNLELRITTVNGLLEQDLRAAQRAIRDKIEDYFARLSARESGSINRIVGLVLSVSAVEDVRLLSASLDDTGEDVLDWETGQLNIGGFPTVLGELHIADPNLPTLLNVVISYPESKTLPDKSLIQATLTNTLMYLNNLNASDQVEEAKRELSYRKLLYVVPLPLSEKPTGSLEDYYNQVAAGILPTLPDETIIKPYQVQFVFTLESGFSRILSQESDTYLLTPFERLSLSGVEIRAEVNNAYI